MPTGKLYRVGRVPLVGGRVEMQLWTPQLRRRWFAQNLIVDAGEALIAALMTNPGAVPPSHAALGDGGTAPDGLQTTLQGTEHQRVALAGSNEEATAIYEATFVGSGSNVTVREAGLFNSDVGGTMLARWLTTVFTLPVGGTFYFKWTAEVAGE